MNAIEYIGPRPQPPARKPWASGWLMIVLVVSVVSFIGWPHVSNLLAKEKAADELIVEKTIAWLGENSTFGNQLAAPETCQREKVSAQTSSSVATAL